MLRFTKNNGHRKDNVPVVQLPDGRKAENFAADLNADQPLALIPQGVLSFLVSLLPQADIAKIMHTFHEKTERVETIEQWVQLLRDELEFHTSVNLLQEYFHAEELETVQQSVVN